MPPRWGGGGVVSSLEPALTLAAKYSTNLPLPDRITGVQISQTCKECGCATEPGTGGGTCILVSPDIVNFCCTGSTSALPPLLSSGTLVLCFSGSGMANPALLSGARAKRPHVCSQKRSLQKKPAICSALVEGGCGGRGGGRETSTAHR